MKNSLTNYKPFLPLILLILVSLLSCNNNTNPVADKTSGNNNGIKVETPIENEKVYFNALPNPCISNFSVNFSIPSNLPVEVTVENIVGDEIKILVNSFLAAGNHRYTADVAELGLKPGVYIIHLRIMDFSAKQYLEIRS